MLSNFIGKVFFVNKEGIFKLATKYLPLKFLLQVCFLSEHPGFFWKLILFNSLNIQHWRYPLIKLWRFTD